MNCGYSHVALIHSMIPLIPLTTPGTVSSSYHDPDCHPPLKATQMGLYTQTKKAGIHSNRLPQPWGLTRGTLSPTPELNKTTQLPTTGRAESKAPTPVPALEPPRGYHRCPRSSQPQLALSNSYPLSFFSHQKTIQTLSLRVQFA